MVHVNDFRQIFSKQNLYKQLTQQFQEKLKLKNLKLKRNFETVKLREFYSFKV